MSYHQDDRKRAEWDKPGACGFVVVTMPVLIAWWLLSPRRRAQVAQAHALRAAR